MYLKILLSIPYLLVVLGSVGMITFGLRFNLTTSLWEQRYSQVRFYGFNGYWLWILSWIFIVVGTLGQVALVWIS
jgi:hypothetical protein